MNNQAKEQKLYSDKKLRLKYDILNKLGEGCFGSIYRAINLVEKRQVALKVQFIKESPDNYGKRITLANQIFILDKLKFIQGVTQVYEAGRWSHGVYMEIQLLSSSLHDQRHKKFTELQIYKMAAELIQVLKKIHSKNVVHQDLKPQNIMRKSDGSFVIIDFGLSAFLTKDIQQTKKRGFIGTPRYASCAAHKGEVQKPKDDIQSLLYVLGFLYTKRAPWFQLQGPIQHKLSKILKIKQNCSEQWLKKCGNAFTTAYQYLKGLNGDEQVNYSFLTNLFQAHRRSYIVKTLKFQNSNMNKFRRKSGNDAENYYMQVPIINLHLIEQKKTKQEKSAKYSVNFQQKIQQINHSCANYSQMAQDGYIQIIQALTDKFLSSLQLTQTEQQNQDYLQINSRQPEIFNLSKLEGLQFKNPFKN